MFHTWTRRPLRIGVAVAVNNPLLMERRWEQLSSVPTTIESGATLTAPPIDAAPSASSAETPPCNIP
jgi:hypothetical protein